MKTSLKKKLSIAILAGCSAMLFSSIAFAAPPEHMPPPPPGNHQMMPPPPHERNAMTAEDREQFKTYYNKFENDYPWMYKSTRDRAVRDYMAIDRALDGNKISENQATRLKREIISFYKNSQKDIEELRDADRNDGRRHHRNLRHLSLYENLDSISEATTIPVATLQRILIPEQLQNFPKDRPGKHKRPDRPYRGELSNRMEDFTKSLVAEGKVTQEEVDALSKFMEDGREQLSKLSREERASYMEKYRDMSEDERLAEVSQSTGISTDRLKEIFQAFKDGMKDKMPPPPPPQE